MDLAPLLAAARREATWFARRRPVALDEVIGVANLALAELLASRPGLSAADKSLVARHVRFRLLDWQRAECGRFGRKQRRPDFTHYEGLETVAASLTVPPVETDPFVRRAVAELPQRERDAVVAVFYDGVTEFCHARSIGRSEARVSQFLTSAKARLRERLSDDR